MKTRISLIAASLATIIVAIPFRADALEAPRAFRADYKLSFLGISIARSSFTSKFSGDAFSMDGSLKSAGLARLFDRTSARTVSSGRIGAGGVEPIDYTLDYTSGKKKQLTAIRFERGSVVSTKNTPPLKKRNTNWVPLDAGDLSAVFDPLTAAMIRAPSPRQVCDRTVRAYDGEMRVDLKLSYAGKKPFSTKGFKGEAIRCMAKFVPVSGYRKGRKALEFMKHKSRIEIAFAPVGGSDIYAPVTASVGTQVGTLRLYATRFAVLK